jgi:hypothetical protein
MECFAKKLDTDEFHPFNYQQLKNAQDKDKTIQKVLKMPKTLYLPKDFHRGGKTTPLACFKEKIVIAGRIQKHAGIIPLHSPWDKLCVDLIGPYKIRKKGNKDLICRCVPMIDPATGRFEVQQYDGKQSITVANIKEQAWFSRYPWPTQVTFDRGSKFIGQDFQKMIKEDYGVKAKPVHPI